MYIRGGIKKDSESVRQVRAQEKVNPIIHILHTHTLTPAQTHLPTHIHTKTHSHTHIYIYTPRCSVSVSLGLPTTGGGCNWCDLPVQVLVFNF